MGLSREKRALALKWHRNGWTNKKIAKELEAHPSTIGRILSHIQQTGHLSPTKSPGRKRILSSREERLASRKIQTTPGATALTISKELEEAHGKAIRPDVIRRSLHRQGLFGRKKAKKPFLNRQQRKARMNFAKLYLEKDENFWRSVIFTDETAFQIFPCFGGQWTWRRPSERLNPKNLAPSVKHGGGSVQVWGCFTAFGIGYLTRLPEGLDGDTYLEVLKDEFIKTMNMYFPKGKNITLQQDGASVHRKREVLAWLEKKKIPILPWPAQSPDLNPIENLWASVKLRVKQNHPNITSKEKLWEAIETEWENTSKEELDHLICSMPARLKAVLKAKGGPTKY